MLHFLKFIQKYYKTTIPWYSHWLKVFFYENCYIKIFDFQRKKIITAIFTEAFDDSQEINLISLGSLTVMSNKT